MGVSPLRSGSESFGMEQVETVFVNALPGSAWGISATPAAWVTVFMNFASMQARAIGCTSVVRAGAVVILLCGGDKGSQERDIERAQDYWRDYRSRVDE